MFLSEKNKNKFTSKYIIMKLQDTKDREKIFKKLEKADFFFKGKKRGEKYNLFFGPR